MATDAAPAPTVDGHARGIATIERRVSNLRRETLRLRLARVGLGVLSAAVLGFVLLPLVIVVVTSFSNDRSIILPIEDWGTRFYGRLLRNGIVQESIRNSLVAAAVSAAIATALSTLAVYALQRRYGRLGRFIETLALFPLLTPLLVYALALVLFSRSVGVGSSMVTLVLGHVTVGLPFAYFAVRASMRTISRAQFHAAEDLGASEWHILRTIAVPQALPGIVSAFIAVFVLSLNEFIVAFFNAGLAQTLPRFIFSQSARSLTPEVSAASTIIVVFTLLVGLAAIWLVRRLTRGRRTGGEVA